MDKEKFLELLEKNLLSVSKTEKEEILEDYIEHFRMGEENGKSEEEMCKALGDPVFLAKQYEALNIYEHAEKEQTLKSIVKAVASTLEFGLFNIFIVLIPFTVVMIILLALFTSAFLITGISTFAAFYSIYAAVRYGSWFFINPVAMIFISIGGIAFGLMFTIFDMYLAKNLYKLIIRYLKHNLKNLKGGEQDI